ncbi:MAG TPA: hypothetical protein GXX15_10570 [Clostridia bacterium]|nr:hypothetical protein [Clostridia bacterium]
MSENNLEYTLNKIAFDIVNEKILGENEISKLLGVLSNDGVYAMWVYAKSDKKVDGNEVMKKFEPLFKVVYPDLNLQILNYENFFQNIAGDLSSLLFFKELFEKVLIYARYHAKAMGE